MRTSLFYPTFFDTLLEDQAFYRGHSHVEENGDGYFIQLDAPGFRREDIKVSVEGRQLLVEGERSGRIQSRLRRAFLLPDDVDPAGIEAQMQDGVLELALPKREQARPKAIPVREAKESFFQKLLGSPEQKV